MKDFKKGQSQALRQNAENSKALAAELAGHRELITELTTSIDKANTFIAGLESKFGQTAEELIRRGISVYTSPGTAEALNLPCDSPFVKRVSHHHKQVRIGSFAVLPFSVERDCAEPLGLFFAAVPQRKN